MKLLLHSVVAGRLVPERFALGSTYIFFGQESQGKRIAAIDIVKQANCLDDQVEPCASCRAIDQGNSPDLLIVEPDGASIGIDQVRDLHESLILTPYRADSQRFVIIDKAELLTTEAQNALLKLIEEPPPRTSVILVTSQLEGLLPTVRSRGRAIYFPPLATAEIEKWLGEQGQAKLAAEIAPLAEGAPGLAWRLGQEAELRQSYAQLNDVATKILNAPLFERLLAIQEIKITPPTLQILLARLAVQARLLADQQQAWALVAVERLLRQLAAGVIGRPALEALALEVPA